MIVFVSPLSHKNNSDGCQSVYELNINYSDALINKDVDITEELQIKKPLQHTRFYFQSSEFMLFIIIRILVHGMIIKVWKSLELIAVLIVRNWNMIN